MIRAKKKYGQNFLTDFQYISNILNAINPKKNEMLLEIGPGLGALTIPLLKRINHLHVVEIDPDMVEQLKTKIPSSKITIYEEDILKTNDNNLIKFNRIIGNLPYYISSAILLKIAKCNECNADLHFMLQKEVAERVTAAPSSSAYGRLSAILQYFYETEFLFEIPPEAFTPSPKITSALIRLTSKPKNKLLAKNIENLEKIIKLAFKQRRKTLKNNFKGLLTNEDFFSLKISSKQRAETLSIDKFVIIENYLSKKKLSI